MSLAVTLCFIAFYMPDLLRSFNTDIILKIGSFLLLLPLSYFLSNELMKRSRENEDLKDLAEKIELEATELEANEADMHEREKLDEIIESAEKIKDQS